jgi:valyl-tRNA synthetase
MDDEATINAAGGPYEGLDRYEARERVKRDLDERGLLVSVVERDPPGRALRALRHRRRAAAVRAVVRQGPAAGRRGRARGPRRAHPVRARAQREGLPRLARQPLRLVHLPPAVVGAPHPRLVRPRRQRARACATTRRPEEVAEAKGLVQDPDVLDTWFSSALWPFTTLGWTRGDRHPELATWYPNAVMETGYDINTFWVSRMLMMGLQFMDDVPVPRRVQPRDGARRRGQEDVEVVRQRHRPARLHRQVRRGRPAFRVAAQCQPRPGRPARRGVGRGARRFCNKLWNAARFVLMRVGDIDARRRPATTTCVEDRWILSRLEATRAQVSRRYDDYDLRRGPALYHFVWDDYCDWYLELAKLRDDRAAKQVLALVLDRDAADAAPDHPVRDRGAVAGAAPPARRPRRSSSPSGRIGDRSPVDPRPRRDRGAAGGRHRAAPVPRRPRTVALGAASTSSRTPSPGAGRSKEASRDRRLAGIDRGRSRRTAAPSRVRSPRSRSPVPNCASPSPD